MWLEKYKNVDEIFRLKQIASLLFCPKNESDAFLKVTNARELFTKKKWHECVRKKEEGKKCLEFHRGKFKTFEETRDDLARIPGQMKASRRS